MTEEQQQATSYEIDYEKEKQASEKKAAGNSNAPKIKWHSLPEGEGLSTWRLLPWVKRRGIFNKVTKHWNVPGFKGSVTCPRSFTDPTNNKPFPCAICEKFFELYKSKEPGDQAFAKQTLKQSTSYYANAVNMDKLEEGVGVLNLPYGVYKTLIDWLDVPKFREFAHYKRGRAFMVKATTVAGSQIPGQPGKEKREYSVIPDDPSEISNEEWLQQLYDLDTIVGIPTYEFTKSCLEKLMTNDPDAGKLPDGVPAYRGRELAAGEAPNSIPPPQQAPTFSQPNVSAVKTTEQVRADAGLDTLAPKFASAAVESVTNAAPKVSDVPTEEVGADGKRLCFGRAFNEDSKTCLKCPTNDACETTVLKAARAAAKVAPTVSAEVKAAPATAKQSEDQIRAMMMGVLNGKKPSEV
jgi:hypothetical protein